MVIMVFVVWSWHRDMPVFLSLLICVNFWLSVVQSQRRLSMHSSLDGLRRKVSVVVWPPHSITSIVILFHVWPGPAILIHYQCIHCPFLNLVGPKKRKKWWSDVHVFAPSLFLVPSVFPKRRRTGPFSKGGLPGLNAHRICAWVSKIKP